jgi:hypothetical protein
VHPHRLQQLVASVPDTADAEQRAKLLAHVQTSDGCRTRIERVRSELEGVLEGGDVPSGDRALDLACQLDGLERVQQRVDGWLVALVDELSHPPHLEAVHAHYGDGVPA